MGARFASPVEYTAKGPAEEIAGWVGHRIVVEAPFAVEPSRIADFCSTLEDDNPIYWDPQAAGRSFGRLVSPPAMLTAWRWPAPWHPKGQPRHGPSIAVEVPFPTDTLINVGFTCNFERPILDGDRLTFVDTVTAISGEKSTALGRGWFVTADTVATNQQGQQVATYRNVMLRYFSQSAGRKGAQAAVAPTPAKPVAPEPEGEPLAEFSVPVTATLCAQLTGATRDYFPGHHDGRYARAQGVADAYPNTGYYCGLTDMAATRWARHDATIVRRALRMHRPAPIGETLLVGGRARAVDGSGAGARVEVDVTVRSGQALVAEAAITLKLGLPIWQP